MNLPLPTVSLKFWMFLESLSDSQEVNISFRYV